MKSIAVLLTVYNRKQKTLSCLHNLFQQKLPDGYELNVYLTNDGCTDGTADAVRIQYPAVHIIQGNGALYWNRGMYIAWKTATKNNNYDYYLWLNDDTNLLEDVLYKMLIAAEQKGGTSIIVGITRSAYQETTTYGGYMKGKLLNPNGTLQLCETFNGNCVLIPKYVYEIIGNLDWTYRHAIGDLDYGYRATRKGICSFVTASYVGICEKNSKLPAWACKEVPFFKRIKNLYSPLGYADPISFFYFDIKNFGVFTAVKHFITIHIRLLFPNLWKKSI